MLGAPPSYTSGNQVGKTGGSGVVIVKEPEGPYLASGVWDMNALYDNVKAGTWTT